MIRYSVLLLASTILLAGCAELQFYDVRQQPDGEMSTVRNDYVSFYETEPAALVAYGGDCSVSVTVVSWPGQRRLVRLKAGYGSNKLSVNFGTGGVLSSINQETDTKVPETITAVGGALKNASDIGLFAANPDQEKSEAKACKAHADLFAVIDGHIGSLIQSFPAAYLPKEIAPPLPKDPPEVTARKLIDDCKRIAAGGRVRAPSAEVAKAIVANCKQILNPPEATDRK